MSCDHGYHGDPCTLCPIGYMCRYGILKPCGQGGYQDKIGTTNCLFCDDPGYHCPYEVNTEQTICPVGHACYGVSSRHVELVVCESGTYQDEVGQSSCKPCPDGAWSDEGASRCTLCPLGHYCRDGEPIQCPESKYQDKEGQSGCKFCLRGTWSGSAASECILCSVGYKCLVGAQEVCEPGTYQDEVGQSTCKPCPEGTESDSAATECTLVCDYDECAKIHFEWVGKSTQMVLYQNCSCDPKLDRKFKIKFELLEEIDAQGKRVQKVPTLANAGLELPEIYEEQKYGVETAKYLLSGQVKIAGFKSSDTQPDPTVSIAVWFFREQVVVPLFDEIRTIEKNSIKWTINITDWPFESSDNTLRLIIDIHSNDSVSINTTSNSNPHTFFPTLAVVDGQDNHDVVTVREHGAHTKVGIELPFFSNTLSYDPFATLPLIPSPVKSLNEKDHIVDNSGCLSLLPFGLIIMSLAIL